MLNKQMKWNEIKTKQAKRKKAIKITMRQQAEDEWIIYTYTQKKTDIKYILIVYIYQ